MATTTYTFSCQLNYNSFYFPLPRLTMYLHTDQVLSSAAVLVTVLVPEKWLLYICTLCLY